jgi:hypothetical protein
MMPKCPQTHVFVFSPVKYSYRHMLPREAEEQSFRRDEHRSEANRRRTFRLQMSKWSSEYVCKCMSRGRKLQLLSPNCSPLDPERSLRNSLERWTAIRSGFPSATLILRFSPTLCWVILPTWLKHFKCDRIVECAHWLRKIFHLEKQKNQFKCLFRQYNPNYE